MIKIIREGPRVVPQAQAPPRRMGPGQGWEGSILILKCHIIDWITILQPKAPSQNLKAKRVPNVIF